MVVDEEVVNVIRLTDGSRTLRDIISSFELNSKYSYEEKLDEVRTLLKILKRANLTYYKEPVTNPAPTNPILENITVNVTRRCNLHCSHCFLEDPLQVQESLAIEDLERFLQEGEHYLSSNLNFAILGGEPLLAKDKTLEIAKLGQERGAEVVVSTNGTLIDKHFAQKAKNAQLVVQVSMEGSNPELNDKIRGQGSFLKAKKGIETLVNHNTYTILSMVVQKANIHDMESFYHLSRSLDVNEVRFIELRKMGRAQTTGMEPIPSVELIFAIRDLLKKQPSAKKYVKRDHYSIMKYICARSNKRAYCGTGLKTILLDSDGEVYPCPNHALPEFACGNIHDKSFEEIWLDSPMLQKVRTTYHIDTINRDCPECPVKYWCLGGCRGETYENTKNLTSRALGCENIRKAIIETFWILSEGEEASSVRTEYF